MNEIVSSVCRILLCWLRISIRIMVLSVQFSCGLSGGYGIESFFSGFVLPFYAYVSKIGKSNH
jgi:hypothetical protein